MKIGKIVGLSGEHPILTTTKNLIARDDLISQRLTDLQRDMNERFAYQANRIRELEARIAALETK